MERRKKERKILSCVSINNVSNEYCFNCQQQSTIIIAANSVLANARIHAVDEFYPHSSNLTYSEYDEINELSHGCAKGEKRDVYSYS